eukprot:TRINITY_DN297_c0_g1_i2.p1 TRINITY_DN297_c0_g1~~TRINITY_DN297_c0_g1_i2.p1  ORF type:complete len:234 (-),score=58.95 TRINITY_DN297_c0_g1_i2:201-902(-)
MMGSEGTGEEHSTRLSKTLKEGERILAPTRRPDGTLRKPIRIRAGYVPQDEVAIYQSKGALLRKAAPEVVPPGYDPILDVKPKTKSAKRNERKKEKKQQQAALAISASDKGKNSDSEAAEGLSVGEVISSEDVDLRSEAVEPVANQMNMLNICATPLVVGSSQDSTETSITGGLASDIDRRIRALKKKIRLTEAMQKNQKEEMKPELLDKVAKLEGWHEELKILEDKKGALVS